MTRAQALAPQCTAASGARGIALARHQADPEQTDSFRLNEAQQRVLQIVLLLAGHEIEGLAQGQVAKAMGSSGSQTHNDLRNLREAGFAERLQNGNWRLGPKPVQVAIAHQQGLARIQAALDEVAQRFSRHPR